MVKNLPANAGDSGDVGLIPESGRFPGEGNGNPLQYSCQENPMDRGAWQGTICAWGLKSLTRLNQHQPMIESGLSRLLRMISFT